MKTLVTGGARSGKSQHAERLLAHFDTVTYIAPGPTSDDPDWAARIAAHQARRPPTWATVETADLASSLIQPGAVLVDCLGTWLTALLDAEQLWDEPSETLTAAVERELVRVTAVLGSADDVVLVTNEVGLGVVPDHRSGRLFRDLLGLTNQRIAEVCDEVHLIIAGRVLVV